MARKHNPPPVQHPPQGQNHTLVQTAFHHYEGPIPSASELEKYEKVMEGAAKFIHLRWRPRSKTNGMASARRRSPPISPPERRP
jgi:hypothetical protein